MKYLRFIVAFATLLLLQQLKAQTVDDGLRYSLINASGTARAAGVGGGLGALGADFSVMSTNPAGLAWYRRSEFVLTPALLAYNSKSTLTNGDPSNAPKETTGTNFTLDNFGLVVAGTPRNIKWSTFNFGIGFNRLADYNRNFSYEGRSTGSIVDRFLELANGSDQLDDFESGVAFDAEALLVDQDGFYFSDFENAPNAQIFREQTINESGSLSELVLSLAGNYDEKLMVGATVGIPFVTFTQQKIYREIDDGAGADGNVPFFDELEYQENLNTTGAGINVKLGLIYRINQLARVGLAVHTPTAFSLSDNFSTSMVYNYSEDGAPFEGSASSPDGLFDYKLRTPWRFIGSTGFVINKYGFISAEAEWVNYGNAQFRYDGFEDDETAINDDIEKTLESAINLRIGGELAMDIFRARAGIGLQQSAVAGENALNKTYSLGVGLRERNFFLDLAYQRRQNESSYTPYFTSQAAQQSVNNEIADNKFILSLGFKF